MIKKMKTRHWKGEFDYIGIEFGKQKWCGKSGISRNLIVELGREPCYKN